MTRQLRFLSGCAAAALSIASCSKPAPPSNQSTAGAKAPLYDNLGNFHYAITTASPDAQKYFDQGLTLSYAFNHAEAIRAFKQAAALDPKCAMCYWGIAFAYGPNINAPITEDAAKEAWQAIEQARAVSAAASERERGFIDALGNRYRADPKAERAPLDRAYAEAMRGLSTRFPDDLEAATLFAQSLMDTAPWNYWDKNGEPRPFTNDVLKALESVLARKPDHVGALHLYIHAVESSPNPGRASQQADRLATLVPGAGHLVHMPGHIYLRTGRYNDASLANQQAIKVDEAYFKGDAVPGNMMYQVGYYPHNIHFFVASASMEGRRADALKAAEQVRGKMHGDMLRDPAMGGMVQHMNLTPLYTKIRFNMWDEVLAEPAPPDGLPFMAAMWHTARGLAHAAQGRVQNAEAERAAVAAVKDDPALKTIGVSSVNVASAIVAIGYAVLTGEIETKQRRADQASRHFAQAVALEDDLTYMEPPDWPVPVRQLQGAALLELGRAKDAEAAFRGDMKKFPDNGWSLSGLHASLEQQGRKADAAAVKARLDQMWDKADVQLASARPRPTER
jgi:tetratricopeptide (TPR) repeat protein